MKSVYLALAMLLDSARRVSTSAASLFDQAPSAAATNGQLRTEYAPKPAITALKTTETAFSAPTSTRSDDLLIGLTFMSVPVVIACGIHLLLVCRRLVHERCEGGGAGRSSPPASVALTTPDIGAYSSPLPPRRAKSKSVTWQSPFETKARPSHRTTFAPSTRAASELHFVMISTPDKYMPSGHTPQSPFRPRRCESIDHTIPQYRLDRLDSSPRESEDMKGAQSSDSSLSVDCSSGRPQHQPTDSPIAMLHDNSEFDSDSPRISLSSMASDDPEITSKLDDAMQRAQIQTDFDVPLEPGGRPISRVMRSSSSLNDFRHDLHHVSDFDDDPEQITRSSEYSF